MQHVQQQFFKMIRPLEEPQPVDSLPVHQWGGVYLKRTSTFTAPFYYNELHCSMCHHLKLGHSNTNTSTLSMSQDDHELIGNFI